MLKAKGKASNKPLTRVSPGTKENALRKGPMVRRDEIPEKDTNVLHEKFDNDINCKFKVHIKIN